MLVKKNIFAKKQKLQTRVEQASRRIFDLKKQLGLLDDTPERTYHIEFRYGSDLTSLYQMLTGKYALWLAAGIPTNADATMIENVIKLFVEENLASNS